MLHSLFAWGLVLVAMAIPCLGATESIADHGAVSDGKTINTKAVQEAVDACAAKGGGTVVVPAGVWVTGSVELKSHITLRLEPGAVLRGSDKLADYPTNGYKHIEMGMVRSLLWAIGQTDVGISGPGMIELVDKPFFDWTQLRTGLSRQQDAQLEDWQKAQCVVPVIAGGNAARPNQPIFFHDCRGLRVEDVTIRNSPCWTLTFSCSQDINVRGVRIDNNMQVPNNDGIHFSGSKNIVVSDCNISAGDDSIAFTGITDPASICEHIVVNNCILHARSAGIRLGHLSAKVRDVAISNVVIRDSNRGFAIQASTGGWVENVMISNCVIETKMFAGAWWGKGEPFIISAADSTGHIKGVTISKVRARAENSILIVGTNQNVSDITLDDVQVSYGYSPNAPLYGTQFDIAPAKLRPTQMGQDKMPWLYADGLAGLRLRDVRYEKAVGEKRELALEAVIGDVKDLVQTPGK